MDPTAGYVTILEMKHSLIDYITRYYNSVGLTGSMEG